MGVDMSNYKMIYENKVYNCVSMMFLFNENRIEELEVIYINEDSRVSLIKDDVSKFQFISK